MSEKYKVRDFSQIHFITVTIVDWVDLLTRPVYKDIIIDSLKHCQENKGMNLHAYVIMSNHFHAIVSSDKIPLNDIVRDLKKFTSKELISTIQQTNESRSVWLLKKFKFAAERIRRGVNYKVWQDGFHPVELPYWS
jgi:putative transposase